jgi:hypothetical protein
MGDTMEQQRPDPVEEAFRERRRQLLAFLEAATCAICGRRIEPGEYRQPTTLYEPPGWSCDPCSRTLDRS